MMKGIWQREWEEEEQESLRSRVASPRDYSVLESPERNQINSEFAAWQEIPVKDTGNTRVNPRRSPSKFPRASSSIQSGGVLVTDQGKHKYAVVRLHLVAPCTTCSTSRGCESLAQSLPNQPAGKVPKSDIILHTCLPKLPSHQFKDYMPMAYRHSDPTQRPQTASRVGRETCRGPAVNEASTCMDHGHHLSMTWKLVN